MDAPPCGSSVTLNGLELGEQVGLAYSIGVRFPIDVCSLSSLSLASRPGASGSDLLPENWTKRESRFSIC